MTDSSVLGFSYTEPCQVTVEQMHDEDLDQTQQVSPLLAPIYAVDAQGVCHAMEEATSDELGTRSNNTDQTMNDANISQTIVEFSKPGDPPPESVNEDAVMVNIAKSVSTQPFSILDFNEHHISSLHLFNNGLPATLLSLSSPSSGRSASNYPSHSLISSTSNRHRSKLKLKKKKKKNPRSRRRLRQLALLKKQLKAYFGKKKQKQLVQDQLSPAFVTIDPPSSPVESTVLDYLPMIDLQITPDLSKRKYIYKDITAASTNPSQINWRIFQCTQQPPPLSSLDQSARQESSHHPFYLPRDAMSLPDIRIGLSRHRSIQHLHKTMVD